MVIDQLPYRVEKEVQQELLLLTTLQLIAFDQLKSKLLLQQETASKQLSLIEHRFRISQLFHLPIFYIKQSDLLVNVCTFGIAIIPAFLEFKKALHSSKQDIKTIQRAFKEFRENQNPNNIY